MMKLFHMFGFNINSSIERKRSQTQQTDNSFYIHSSRMKNLPIPPMYDQGPQVHQNGRTVNNYLTLLEKIYYTLKNCNLNWFILFSINVLFLTVRCGHGGLMQALMQFSTNFLFLTVRCGHGGLMQALMQFSTNFLFLTVRCGHCGL